MPSHRANRVARCTASIRTARECNSRNSEGRRLHPRVHPSHAGVGRSWLTRRLHVSLARVSPKTFISRAHRRLPVKPLPPPHLRQKPLFAVEATASRIIALSTRRNFPESCYLLHPPARPRRRGPHFSPRESARNTRERGRRIPAARAIRFSYFTPRPPVLLFRFVDDSAAGGAPSRRLKIVRSGKLENRIRAQRARGATRRREAEWRWSGVERRGVSRRARMILNWVIRGSHGAPRCAERDETAPVRSLIRTLFHSRNAAARHTNSYERGKEKFRAISFIFSTSTTVSAQHLYVTSRRRGRLFLHFAGSDTRAAFVARANESTISTREFYNRFRGRLYSERPKYFI